MPLPQSVYRLPDGLDNDLDQLRVLTGQFQDGAISASRFQAFRVPQGVYEQRESGKYMLRARLAAGILTPGAMRAAAEVAETWGNGTLHFTTRQDLQVHAVDAAGIYPAVVALTRAGLSTKGGGGNTVRNIAACLHAGVCRDEVFDVAPHAIELTEALLPDPLSFQLPRKYKIACSGCSRDCAGASVNDLGLIARRLHGVEGFAVYVGGGMGTESRVGTLLEPFIPTHEAARVAEAVKRVFDQHGNRKNRNRARLRFLIADLGFEAFERLYRAELGGQNRTAAPGATTPRDRHSTVLAEKERGRFTVEIAPPLGVMEAARLRALAAVVERYGERVLRATNWQTALLRGVPEADVAALQAELAGLELASEDPPILRHMVCCAGASTCRLGICLSRGLAKAIRRALLASGLDFANATGNLAIHISGCPNACGRHPVADIGLHGAAKRWNGRLAPYYVVQLGGRVEEGRSVLASGKVAVPARHVPGFLVGFLRAFAASPRHPDFGAFLENGGRECAQELSEQHAGPSTEDEEDSFYTDWDAAQPFSLAGRGPAECGAGVFDLIDLDLDAADEALRAGRRLSATVSAARALLVTRGEQVDTAAQALEAFERLFIVQRLLPDDWAMLVERAREAAGAEDPEAAFDGAVAEVDRLILSVRKLYSDMGPSLRIPASK